MKKLATKNEKALLVKTNATIREDSSFQKPPSLVIERVAWASDLLSIVSILRKRGGSLYLLLPASIVRALSLKDKQKAKITVLTSERGARVGLFVDLGTPKLTTILYEVEFVVESSEAGRALINRITNAPPLHFASLEGKDGKVSCVIKFTNRDPSWFFEVRNMILKEARNLGIKLLSLNVKQEEASLVPLDSSLLKEVIREVEGYELVWE